MPLYEYVCEKDHVFTDVCPVHERHDPHFCPRCGSLGTKAILTPPRVFSDYGGYESPASGKWIEGRRARIEDLARTGCRPYELGEREHHEQVQKKEEAKLDAQIDVAVERTLTEITL